MVQGGLFPETSNTGDNFSVNILKNSKKVLDA
jgi:hypothetical protein